MSNLNNTGTNKSNKNCNNVDSKLKLKEFGNTVVDVTTPFYSLDDAREIVIGQHDIWCFLCNIGSSNTLAKQLFLKFQLVIVNCFRLFLFEFVNYA